MAIDTAKAIGPSCPKCRTQDGKAFSVSAHDGTITVAYRCPSCGHHWSDRHDDPDRTIFAVMRSAR